MTLATTTSRISYAGNGTAGPFAYTWKIFSDGDLKVYVADVLKTKTTHYTVSGVGVAGGGDVTFTTGNFPATSAEIVIYRDQPLVQETDLIANGQIPAESLETQFDKIVMQIQTIEERLKKVPMLSEGKKTTELPITLADPVIGAPLVWDTTGKIITTGTATWGKKVSVQLGSNQTIPGNGVFTKITLNSKIYDVLNEFDATTNYRFQPSVAGGYLVTVNMRMDYIANVGVVVAYIQKTSLSLVGRQRTNVGSGESGHVSLSVIVDMATSDWVDLLVENHATGNVTIPLGVTQMEIVRLW